MNIKILKFIVVFMGFLIFIGVIILGIGIYYKINNFNIIKKKEETISLKIPKNFTIKDYSINNEYIIVNYQNKDNKFIYIYDIVTGNILKKIELLK